jgi:hypothetical protein
MCLKKTDLRRVIGRQQAVSQHVITLSWLRHLTELTDILTWIIFQLTHSNNLIISCARLLIHIPISHFIKALCSLKFPFSLFCYILHPTKILYALFSSSVTGLVLVSVITVICYDFLAPKIKIYEFYVRYPYPSGLCSSVGIATGYGIDGPGIYSRWGRDFPHLSRPALGSNQPPVQRVPGLSRG